MYQVLILSLFTFVHCAYYEERYEFFEKNILQKNGPITWKFGKNKYFENKSRAEILRLLGTLPDKEGDEPVFIKEDEQRTSSVVLPKEYDVRKQWPQCKNIPLIKDQSNCASCWAVASASVMSDRLCIASNGTSQVMLSEEDLISCCETCGKGCNGGSARKAFKYWRTTGIPTGGPYAWKHACKPYSIPPCDVDGYDCKSDAKTPSCRSKCIDPYETPLKTDRSFGLKEKRFDGMQSMMEELYLNGPLVVSYSVFEDFLIYTGGIYNHTFGIDMGGHSARLLGWGEEGDTKYWLLANSWNTTFGEEGYFRIVRGVNECGIETKAVASKPAFVVD